MEIKYELGLNPIPLCTGTTPLQNRLKKGSVPHIFAWDKQQSNVVMEKIQRGKKRKMMALEAELDLNACVEIGASEEVTVDNVEVEGKIHVLEDL